MENRKMILVEYLKSRGINDPDYFELLMKSIPEYEYQLCSANGYDFMLSHLLDDSDKEGYGLIRTNQNLHTETGHDVAIGLAEGDDVICMDTRDGSISLWLVENGSGEHKRIASSFAEFWKMAVIPNEGN